MIFSATRQSLIIFPANLASEEMKGDGGKEAQFICFSFTGRDRTTVFENGSHQQKWRVKKNHFFNPRPEEN